MIDSLQNCYETYAKDEITQQQIMFKALVDFTQLNHACYDKSCSTICRRMLSLNDGNFGNKVRITCCQRDPLNPRINITKCLNFIERPFWYVPWSILVIVFPSLFLAGFTFNKLTKVYSYLRQLKS